MRVLLDESLTGDAARDARRLLDAVRAGRVFTAIDAIAGPAWVDYHATRGEVRRNMGETLTFEDETTLVVPVDSSVRGAGRVAARRRRNSRIRNGGVDVPAPGPGAYRVEVRSPRWDVPWIVTNPIYLRGSGEYADWHDAAVTSAGLEALALVDPGSVESDPASTATLTTVGGGAVA